VNKLIRIGTRDSQLALWQANTVKDKLEELGYETQLVAVKSDGDLALNTPLYKLGITGIFTKTLDMAMLNGSIDIAVHSMKDVPTLLHEGIAQTAVLERASSLDILVTNGTPNFQEDCTIASGSLRRRAQWLHRYPLHKVVGLRGNVNTRLRKLEDSDWQGAIFAKAGLERIKVLPEYYIDLDWMIPAPAQGAMVVVALAKDDFCMEATSKLNVTNAQICTHIEREFLRVLEGGCTAPIGALAETIGTEIHFKGGLYSLDGTKKLNIDKTISIENYRDFGRNCAEKLLIEGGNEIMESIKKETT